jgi:hypothetical protein
MATINNQATLRTAVADWLNRSDLTTIQIDQFIEMGEAMIYETLRVPTLEAKTTNTVVPAISSIDVPNGFLELIELKFIDTDNEVSLNRVDPKAFHNNEIPHSFVRDINKFDIRNKEGKEEALGVYELKFYQTDLPVGTVVGGVEQIPYVLEEYELSLYSALAFGSAFLGDVETEERYINLVNDKINNLNAKAIRSEMKGGIYASSFYEGLI